MATKNSIGRLSMLAINTGTYETPVWTPVKRIGDVDIEDGSATSDRDTRESPNTKTVVGNTKFGIKFEYGKIRGLTDTVFDALKAARRSGECIDCLALDDDISVVGASGIRGPFVVTAMNKKEPINDQEVYAVEMYEGFNYDDDDEIIDTVAVVVGASGLEEPA